MSFKSSAWVSLIPRQTSRKYSWPNTTMLSMKSTKVMVWVRMWENGSVSIWNLALIKSRPKFPCVSWLQDTTITPILEFNTTLTQFSPKITQTTKQWSSTINLMTEAIKSIENISPFTELTNRDTHTSKTANGSLLSRIFMLLQWTTVPSTQ